MSVQFTDQEIAEFQAAFEVFDTDGSGMISCSEMETAMQQLGVQMSLEEIRQLVRESDVDGDGEVSFPEFVELMQKQQAQSTPEEEMRAAFSVFDRNNSGTISASELRDVMLSLGEALTDEELRELMTENDVDGDGEISYEEFVQMMGK